MRSATRSRRDTAAVVEKTGGKVLGKVRHPLNTNDFSSFLLQAQSSKAKVIGLANAGGDTINSIKQAAEFGIVKGGQNLAGLLVFASDVNALGLQTAQGLALTETWYWDANDANRAWTKRWHDAGAAAGKFPTMIHAGVYAGITHYLKARLAMGAGEHDGKSVVAKMKSMPTDDPLFGKGEVRADGRGHSPGLSVRSEEAVGIEISRRLLQAPRHHSGQRSLPSAQRRQVPAGQRLIVQRDKRGGRIVRPSSSR